MPREKREWTARVTELLAPCSDVPVSVAQCVQEKRRCAKCVPAAKFVAKMVRDGMSQEQIEAGYHARFDSDKLKSVDVGKAPFKGPEGAPVTLVEFADFECPYCARVEGAMKEIEKAYGDRVRVVWHDMPLPFHESALPAARAAREARKQKGDHAFWTMHDTLFADHKLSRDDLDADAKTLGLDMKKWAAALDGDAHTAEIDADSAAADKLGFKGTPSFVIVAAGAKTGYAVVGALPFSRFRKVIEIALHEPPR
jgi:protein-disulfide isomerase